MRAIILGTGPSVTDDVRDQLRATDVPIFGCNNAYQIAPVRALYANNREWWDHYWPRDPALRHGDFEKWTYERDVADRYGIAHIRGVWKPGLSTDPEVIHYGHGSGYELIGVALHYGVTEFVLVGYDLRYPKGYNGFDRQAGGDRHYFGEYPPELQHWTKYNIGQNGELNGLLDMYRTIDPDEYGIRIVNCTPGSALDFFDTGKLEEWI